MSFDFEIREHTAATVVETTNCTIDNDVLTSFSARVHIAAEDFSAQEILQSSLRIILRAPDGSFLSMQPVQMSVEECWLNCEVEAEVNVNPNIPYEFTECPTEIIILGVGLENGQIAFEWGAAALNVPDPNARETLALIVGYEPSECVWECDEVEPCDPPRPPIECTAIPSWLPFKSQAIVDPFVVGGTGACRTVKFSEAKAYPSSGSGRSTLHAQAITAGCGVSTEATARSGGMYLFRLEGDCCECEIEASGVTTAKGQTQLLATVVHGVSLNHSGNAIMNIYGPLGCGFAIADAYVNEPYGPSSHTDTDFFSCSVSACIGTTLVYTWINVGGGTSVTAPPDSIMSIIRVSGAAFASMNGQGETCEPDPCEP